MTALRDAGRNPEAGRFLRFCVVGGAGFVADTGILLAVVHLFGINPVVAKMASFACAVLLTFELNRRWAFGTVRHARLGTAFMAYLGVQGTGFLCNSAVFAALIYLLPSPFNNLLLCAVIASGVALVVNYAGAKHMVFGIRPLLQGR